ncbi:MAG: tyrosine-type recombinase/integrase [Acetivibrio ethanolgignens]
MASNTYYSQKILDIVNQLPDFCYDFICNTNAGYSPNTRLEYARDIQLFLQWLLQNHPEFCDLEMKNISIEHLKKLQSYDIARFISWYSLNHAPRTTARKRATLSAFFSYLCENRALEYSPVTSSSKVKLNEKNLVYLEHDERDKFLNTVEYGNGMTNRELVFHDKYKKRDTAIFSLLLDTGLRISELQQINIKNLDLEKCNVIVTRKGGDILPVYFSDNTALVIEEYLEEKKEKFKNLTENDPLFTTLKGDRIGIRALQKLTKKYANIAVPQRADELSPHKLRSTFAMDFYEASGNNILLLQKKLNHKNIQTTNIYAKASDKQDAESRNLLQNAKNQRKKQK